MFKLSRTTGFYTLYYRPTRLAIVTPTLPAAMRHMALIQSILAKDGKEAVRIMRTGPRMSGKTFTTLAAAINK